MRILVGSRNPVKINATEIAFSQYFQDIQVEGYDTDSGVSEMPVTEEETRQGAINRARNLMDKEGDYYVGIEGGTKETEHGMMLIGYTAIIDSKERIGLSGSEGFLLPDSIADRIRKGEELGPVMDDITDLVDVSKKNGAIGIFTKDRITRTEAFVNSLTYSLVKFVNPEFYD